MVIQQHLILIKLTLENLKQTFWSKWICIFRETITMSFQSSGIMHRLQNCLKADKSGRPQSEASSCEISDSSCSISAVDRIKLNKNVSTNKPLRDATQILSILLEPMALMSNDAESTANSMIGQLSSAKGLKGSDVLLQILLLIIKNHMKTRTLVDQMKLQTLTIVLILRLLNLCLMALATIEALVLKKPRVQAKGMNLTWDFEHGYYIKQVTINLQLT